MENNLIRSFSEEFDNRKCSRKFFCFYVSSILLSGSLTVIIIVMIMIIITGPLVMIIEIA